MLIVWRGFGFLIPLFALISLLVSAKFADRAMSGGVALLLSAALLLPMGLKLNREVKRAHSLFWIPMQYWAGLFAFWGVLLIAKSIRGI